MNSCVGGKDAGVGVAVLKKAALGTDGGETIQIVFYFPVFFF